MSVIGNLPNEILTATLSFLPTTSLQQALLISHRFRALAELLLYTSVSIQEAVQLTGSHDGGPYKTWRWCRTILERPHLVHCVKSLTIKWFADHHAKHANQHPYYARPAHPVAAALIGDIDLEPIFVELATILPNLTLLESLELHLPTSVSTPTGPETHLALGNRLLRPTSFPHLTYLAISGLVPPPQFFLPSTCPSLTTLRFSDIHELPYAFPYDALPNLSNFKGSPAAAAVILPGRPVTSLSLVGFECLRVAEWEGITQVQSIEDPAYRGIETLDLSGMSVTPNLLRDVARWVPTVKDLKIRLALRHTIHHGLGGIVSEPTIARGSDIWTTYPLSRPSSPRSPPFCSPSPIWPHWICHRRLGLAPPRSKRSSCSARRGLSIAACEEWFSPVAICGCGLSGGLNSQVRAADGYW